MKKTKMIYFILILISVLLQQHHIHKTLSFWPACFGRFGPMKSFGLKHKRSVFLKVKKITVPGKFFDKIYFHNCYRTKLIKSIFQKFCLTSIHFDKEVCW